MVVVNLDGFSVTIFDSGIILLEKIKVRRVFFFSREEEKRTNLLDKDSLDELDSEGGFA